MTRRDWQSAEGHRLGVFLNGDAINELDARRRARRRRLVPPALQRVPRAGRLHAAAAALRPALDARALHGRRRGRGTCSRRAAVVPLESRSTVVLRRAVSDEWRCTYRLQLGPDLDFRGRARARPVPARPRRQPPVPLARRCRRAEARRTATTSSTRRASRRTSAARPRLRALCAAGLGVRARHRPEPHGDRRREPLLGRPRAARAVLRLGPANRLAPALLRRSTSSRGVRVEDPEVFEVTHAKVLELVARRARRRPAHRPSRRARESARATSSGSPRPGRRARLGREDPRARRAAARVAGRGHDRATSSLNDVTALFVDPAGEAAADRAVRRADRRDAPFAEVAARGEARAGAHDVPARGRAAAAAAGDGPGLEERGRLAARVPDLRRARHAGGSRRPTARRSSVLPEELRRVAAARGARRRRSSSTRFQQTTGPVMAKGVEDTAFYRYVRLTALNEVGGDPGRFGTAPSRSSTARTLERARALPAAPARDADARHEALRRRARAHRRARRDGRRVGRACATRGGSSTDGHDERDQLAARRSSARGRSTREPARGLPREGAARGASRNTSWVEPDERARARVSGVAIGRFYERLPAGFEEFVGRAAAERATRRRWRTRC